MLGDLEEFWLHLEVSDCPRDLENMKEYVGYLKKYVKNIKKYKGKWRNIWKIWRNKQERCIYCSTPLSKRFRALFSHKQNYVLTIQ